MVIRHHRTTVPRSDFAFLALAVAAALQGGAASARALVRAPDPAQPICVVAHVDVLSEHTAQARAVIQDYVRATRLQPGALQAQAMQELRPNHFDLIEEWRDEASYPPTWLTPPASAFRTPSRLGAAVQSRRG